MMWNALSSKKRADFPLFKVFEDLVELPNGRKLNYYRIEKIPVVAILRIFADKIVMVKQYRYPIQSYSLELPAGHMASAGSTEEYTKTEATEETDFSASRIERLTSYARQPSSLIKRLLELLESFSKDTGCQIARISCKMRFVERSPKGVNHVSQIQNHSR